MARKRNVIQPEPFQEPLDGRRVNLQTHRQSRPPRKQQKMPTSLQTAINGFLFSLAVAALALVYFVVDGYRNNLAQPPVLSDLPRATVSGSVNPNSWGTYRSHTYFSLTTRDERAPILDLLWLTQPLDPRLPIRSWAKHEDGVRYMWTDADGESFGRQVLNDSGFEFETNWLGIGRSFGVRVEVKKIPPPQVQRTPPTLSLVFVFLLRDLSTSLLRTEVDGKLESLEGASAQFGPFRLDVSDVIDRGSHATIPLPEQLSPMQFEPALRALLVMDEDGKLRIRDEVNDITSGPKHIAFLHVDITRPENASLYFEVEGDEMNAHVFDREFPSKLAAFRSRLDESLFEGATEAKATAGRTAVSNMLGSVGYWNGYCQVKVPQTGETAPYGPISLLSGVPSRPFFPRGFLWDEGFHNLVIKEVNPMLTLNILRSWMDIISSNGWIPREVILGAEAESRVPAEYIVQLPNTANPPSMFLTIDSIIRDSEFMSEHSREVLTLYPRLKLWYTWLRDSQRGPHTGTFRWRGRNETTILELNPKTMASGLDDFPRASHPSSDEYHLDLLCWMAMCSKALRQLAEYASDNAFMPEIERDIKEFNSLENLNKFHWSEKHQRYLDYGLHSTDVRLVATQLRDRSTGEILTIVNRHVNQQPKLRLVEDVYGYVNLFPLLLRILPGDAPQIGPLLSAMSDPEQFFTPYGIRSISRKSRYYRERNTQHDPPYWRGNVWINVNYLALGALRHYSHARGPNQVAAGSLYVSLRNAVVDNIVREFEKTGEFWEHYDDLTGKGGGTHPFTGWTALVARIIAEKYD